MPAPAPMAPTTSGHEFVFDGYASATYANAGLAQWTGSVAARGTILTNSGCGFSLTGMDQANLTGPSLNIVGGEVDVYKTIGDAALGVSYAVASGNGVTVNALGVQGALFAGNFQLRGSYAHTFEAGLAPAANSLTGRVAYFFAPNTQANISVMTASNGTYNDTTFGIGAEHKFQSSPFSLFGGLAYSSNTSATSVTVGVRFTPSALSLQDFTRKVPF